MKKIIIWVFVILFFLGATGAGSYLYWKKKPTKETLPSNILATAIVEKGDITNKIVENGFLEPLTKVSIKANATGTVQNLYVDIGSIVKKGDKLAVIQPGRPGEKYKPSFIISPANGVIISKNVELGDTVTSGLSEYGSGSEVMVLADLKNILITTRINDVDIDKLELGQEAIVKLNSSSSDKSFPAKICRISPIGIIGNDNFISQFEIKAHIEGVDPELKPGRSALMEIVLNSKKGVPILPIESVFDENGKNIVYVVKNNKLSKIEISTGLSDNNNIEIISGVTLGQKVSKVRPLSTSDLDKISKSKFEQE